MKISPVLLILSLTLIALSGCVEENSVDSMNYQVSSETDSEPEEPVEPIDYSAANLTLSLMPTELSSKEISNLQLSLKNEGNSTVNVAKLQEHVTYNIIYSNVSDIEYSELPSIDAMGDDSLVELKPNESLSIDVSSRSWQPFSKGNHSLSAKYFVTGPNVFTKPHWSGTLRSNNITLIVE